MDIYCLGDRVKSYDEPSETEEKYLWLVYDYDNQGYEGYGEAVALGYDGLLYIYNLDHCSCYGPFDCFGNHNGGMTVEKYLEDEDYVTDTCNQTIRGKVKQLMGL